MPNFRIFSSILCFFLVITGIYFLSSTSLDQITRSKVIFQKSLSQEESILLYRAYYDNRTGPGNASSNNSLTHVPLELKCPWHWAPDCKWNAYHFQSKPIKSPPSTISVNLAGRSVHMDVHSAPSLTESITICVPPLYWYDDWPRLILFVEYQKREGASIIIYANSVSANVKRVLDHYESDGIVKVINWPMLPKLKDGEDPNKSVYRLAHSLAHNDCVLRSSSKYTALIDVDEFIYVRNSSLLEFVKSKFSNKATGSLQFQHFGLISKTQLDESFDALNSMDIRNVTGPSKVLFNPSSIHFLSTHSVNTHAKGFRRVTVPTSEAFLLHMRVSFGERQIGDRVAIDDRFLKLKDRVMAMRNTIFGSTVPVFTLNVSNEVIQCTATWRSDGCKTPIHSCFSQLIPIEEWHFFGPSSNSHFEII